MNVPICAWVTRHRPTVDQIHALKCYQIEQVLLPGGTRFESGYQAWNMLERVCGRPPALIVAVLPEFWRAEFLQLAARHAPDAPIVRAVMRPPLFREWSGRWQALSSDLTWQAWSPETPTW